MAETAFSATTAVTTLVNLQKKVQGDVLFLFQKQSPEYQFAKSLDDKGLGMSAREVSQPAQLEERGGGAFIEEFGYEAEARSVAPRELTYTFAQYNDRIALSTFARLQNQGDKKAALNQQVQFQVNQMAQGFGRRFAQTFWGLSTGQICLTSTNATSASQTLVLYDVFGQTESSADNAAYLARQFCIGDRIALAESGGAALVTNGFGTITAITPATPSIAVTMVGSCDVDATDEIYFAQSVRNDTASLASCDINKWPTGIVGAVETTTVHGLSGSTVPEWAAAGNNSDGGRLNGTRIMLAQDTIQNKGGNGPWVLLHSQGVKRDIFNQQVAAVRFQDPMNMRLDGAVKVGEGITPFVSKWNPPGRAVLMPKGALSKWFLNPMPNPETGERPDFGDQTQVDKVPNRAGHYIGLDAIYGFVHKRNFYYQWKSLSES